ncbi:MAG: tetratricopeptide repeat protein [Planctomycetes bacterium]|nr:tetratricopeptide repeat protein [Planctomycetota bacterium]MCB9869347.1 tetratricopeptide repeat protein [Planctomycetota bacterium]
MQGPLIIVSSLVLSAGMAAGVVLWLHAQPAGSPVAPASTEAAELASRLKQLEKDLAELRAVAGERAPQRQATQPVSDAQIEAAVQRFMSKSAVPASAGKAVSSGMTAKQAYLQLLSGEGSDQDRMDLWTKVRKGGQIDEVVKMFEENAKMSPSDVGAQFGLGSAYIMKLQDMPPGMDAGIVANKADKAFDRALEIDANHWDARMMKATALSFWPPMFGKQAEAIRNFEVLRKQQEQVASANPPKKFARTYLTLGNLYSQQGKADKAKECWTRGLELFPDDGQLRKQLGQ